MKKYTSLILLLILLLSHSSIASADAEPVKYSEGTLYYIIEDGSITIIGCFGRKETITVPSQIAGYPVSTIAAGAFASNTHLKTLVVPDTVTTIEYGAIGENVNVYYGIHTGDVNGDRTIDVEDCAYIRYYTVDLVKLDSAQNTFADVNCDGNVNVIDVNLLRRYLAGLITSFPAS